jgi:hypothetical protein
VVSAFSCPRTLKEGQVGIVAEAAVARVLAGAQNRFSRTFDDGQAYNN